MARTTKKDSSAKAADAPVSREEMENRIQPLANNMTMIQWVVGFGFGLVLIAFSIVFGIIAQFTINNANEATELRRKNTEIRAELKDLKEDHHELDKEFEIYKSQTPPNTPQ